ncbi:hypothetical protein INT47_006757 [Mucor saturninus]|uniref:Homeobox domain-containing protein n=1 Tax=Mucor saturninus TaxID=64648 RepID=A0A8H7QYQ4_9FUNG|nr:hypothetical protein INT47_006757 [Mucor saturninus]
MNNYMSNSTSDEKDQSAPRKRTRATPEQLSVLEKTFHVNPSPNNRVREQLSRELGMSERSIQIWFQNRRAKVKNIAKKSSILHDETLRMQYYASSAAAAACQAAIYQQHQQNGEKPSEMEIGDPIKTNPDLYYYYYYYYFNQQQQLQQRQKQHMYHPYGQYHTTASSVPPPPISLKSMPPPPPPPPTSNENGSISPSSSDHSLWSSSKKPRTRAHTIGPSMIQQRPRLFDRGNSVEMIPNYATNYTHMLNTTTNLASCSPPNFSNLSVGDTLLPYQTPTSFFDTDVSQPQPSSLTWTDLPFYQDPTMMMTPTTPSMFTPTTLLQPYFDPHQKISAEALQIGTWKRMGFEPSDLVCQFDKNKKSFSWCIQDGPSRFKMEFSQSSVQKMQLLPLEGRAGWARLEISVTSNEISFYMEVAPEWVQCRDYTEDKQASIITLHHLDGPALALKAELESLKKENGYLASIMN